MSMWFEESIPVEKKQFIEILRSTIAEDELEAFDHFAKLLDHYHYQRFKNVLEQLYAYYKPFSPDGYSGVNIAEEEEESYAKNLVGRFKKFLEQAQYQQIGAEDIKDILRYTRAKALKIIFPAKQYREFLVYYRDECLFSEDYRSWRTLWLKRHKRKVPYYKRLAILFRPFRKTLEHKNSEEFGAEFSFAKPQSITIKLFKDIRQDYLPIIFPGIFLKISIKRKLYLLFLLILTTLLGTLSPVLFPSSWFALIAIIPFLVFIKSSLKFEKQNKQYYRRLLSHFYHKNVSNNSGVLSYLTGKIAEEKYKQHFLVLHAFWKKSQWATSPVSSQHLVSYLKNFMLESFGIHVDLNLENVLPDLLLDLEDGKLNIPPLLSNNSSLRSYLKIDSYSGGRWFDIENTQLPIPNAGMVRVAPGTERFEICSFYKDEFVLYFEKNLRFSHPKGAAIRWTPKEPYYTRLTQDCQKESEVINILEEDIYTLPLHGIGKIESSDGDIEFRYHRKWGSNKLFLDAGLRYRHEIASGNAILVRPILPTFTLNQKPENKMIIPLPENIVFPLSGLIQVATKEQKKIIPYELNTKGLALGEKLDFFLDVGTVVSLVPPTTRLKAKVTKGSSLLPVKTTKHFSKRGVIVISPEQQNEERIGFSGESLELKLKMPLAYRHPKGSLVQIKGNDKSKLVFNANRGSHNIIIQGLTKKIESNTIIINPGEQIQEKLEFEFSGVLIELDMPLRHTHFENAVIYEAKIESSLRYDALQGNSMITVEDASGFPLSGTLEIDFNGIAGIKEVFSFERTLCSNTLILKSQAKRFFKKDSVVKIIGVEISSHDTFYYNDISIKADFSCVPSFPESGRVIIEPGSQMEEVREFSQFPNRIYLSKPCKYSHSIGTALDFSYYTEGILSEAARIGDDYISLDFAHLLPERGCLKMYTSDGYDLLWYRKWKSKVMLEQPSKFHHQKGTRVVLPSIDNKVTLALPIEKGTQEIELVNAQELPTKGKIEISGMFSSSIVQFNRVNNTLYLKKPMNKSYSIHATLKIPDIHLIRHLTPGVNYIDVTDASVLPKTGTLLLLSSKTFRKKSKQEKISFQYKPEVLWLDTPLKKRYDKGTRVQSFELYAKGASNIKAIPADEAVKKLEGLIASIYSRNESAKNDVNLCNVTQSYLERKTS